MFFSRSSAVFAGFLLSLALLSAQIRPAGAGGTSPGLSGAAGSTGGMTSSTNSILLTGKVVLDDGSAVPEPVKLELKCLGLVQPEGFTDSKGRFSITLGQEPDAMADASEGATPGQKDPIRRNSNLQNCELHAILPGFRSDTVSLMNHLYVDNADIGTIVLHRLADVEGLTISATSALAPKDAEKAYEKGLESRKKNKTDEAQKEFEKAVELYPKYAAAWFELGLVYESRSEFDQARDAYHHSNAADANYINPYERIYELDAKDGKWGEMADVSEKVMHLNPYDFPLAYYFNSVANLRLGKLDAAEKSAREAVKLDTGHKEPREVYLLGIILANKQQFKEAASVFASIFGAFPERERQRAGAKPARSDRKVGGSAGEAVVSFFSLHRF
jgi:tetratricopeptide (TPR) repeat protein